MREQLRPMEPAIEPGAEEAPGLAALLRELGQAPDGAAALTVSQLAARLEQLKAASSGDDVRALVEGLEQRRFDGLLDGQGRKVRQLAVEALLRLGYPWALQITPADLEWYRAQARARSPSRRLLLAVLVALFAALGAVGWWTVSAAPPRAPVVAPRAAPLSSSLEVYRTESGARLAEVNIAVPASVAPGAFVELGAVRAYGRSGPALEVLRLHAEGLATDHLVNGVRTLTLQVPLTPERFAPNKPYFFVIDLWVAWKPAGSATTPSFEVTSPPVRRATQRSASMAETWALDGPAPPHLRDPARLLLGVDLQGNLRWHQFLVASPADRSALEAYLEGVKVRGLPMFHPRPGVTPAPSGGIIDWSPEQRSDPAPAPAAGGPLRPRFE